MFAARGGWPSHRPHPHCTLFPPHEQLLVAAVGGAVVVVILRRAASSVVIVISCRDMVALVLFHVSSSFWENYNLSNEQNKLVSLWKKKGTKKELAIGPNNTIVSFGPGHHQPLWHGGIGMGSFCVSSSFRGKYNLVKERNKLVSL
jgi:hypothetical protein